MREIKTFNMRMPKEMWIFLKTAAMDKETSMMEIVMESLNKYKKSYEKSLTKSDALV